MHTNRKEIRVYASSRSGHHAVIFWILYNSVRPSIFANDIYRRSTVQIKNSKSEKIGVSFFTTGMDKEDIEKEDNYSFGGKYSYIFTIEEPRDWPKVIEHVAGPGPWRRGSSEEVLDCIVLRDPFNHLASRLGLKDPVWPLGKLTFEEWVELYKAFANEFLGRTKYFKNKKVSINYNSWFISKDYRGSLGIKFGLVGCYRNQFQSVPALGGGSSFNGVSYQHKAGQMDVLNRWRNFATHPEIKALAKDSELMYLATKIFLPVHSDFEDWINEIQNA